MRLVIGKLNTIFNLVVFLNLCLGCLACFITDCPRRGRRFLSSDIDPNKISRECALCGPSLGFGSDPTAPNDYRCFGEKLCCSPTAKNNGCIRFNTTADGDDSVHDPTNTCVYEAREIATPCASHTKVCHTVDRGQCVADGYCCNIEGQCFMDSECKREQHSPDDFKFNVMKLLQNLDSNLQLLPSPGYTKLPSGDKHKNHQPSMPFSKYFSSKQRRHLATASQKQFHNDNRHKDVMLSLQIENSKANPMANLVRLVNHPAAEMEATSGGSDFVRARTLPKRTRPRWMMGENFVNKRREYPEHYSPVMGNVMFR